MLPTPPRHSQPIAAGAQADRPTDPNHHTHIPHPSSPTPAPPPPDLSQHWQSLLAEKTALLGYEITLQPDRPSSATRKLRTQSPPIPSPASAHPATTPPPSAILAGPGFSDRMSVGGEGFSSVMQGKAQIDVKTCPISLERCKTSEYDRISPAQPSGLRSHFPPPIRLLRRGRKRSRSRRAGVCDWMAA